MCGIIGYIGNKEIVPLLLSGLSKLEYRGYDSAGICVIQNNSLQVVKKSGRISELEKQPFLKGMHGSIGIAHTRWATHGAPNEINAHPHTDCGRELAIVHNGIIENYRALKELLEKEGHTIVSETDSEIVAHLIEKFYTDDLESAVAEALKCVEGTFGLAVVHKDEDKIVAARRGSPLIIGIGNKEMFVTSDVVSILSHTRTIAYLHDNEIATITKNGYAVKNLDGQRVDSKIHEVKWTIDKIEKRGFKHFMLKEIFEQPEAIENTLRGRLLGNKIKITVHVHVNGLGRIILLGCGTSRYSAMVGKYLIERIAGIPVEVDYASEFRYRNPVLNKNDLVVAISQSGETADTLAALREAKAVSVQTMGIVNVVSSTIAREVDSGIYLHAGPEIGVASTKSFTSQIAALLLFALYLRQERGLPLDQTLLGELSTIAQKVKESLKQSEEIRKIAEKFKDSRNFIYLGRGLNFPVALEGALKLKEISYIHAEGYPAAEMKHGPIALVDENMPVVFVCPKDQLFPKILSNMEEVKARKGVIIAVIDEMDDRICRLADHVILVPKTREELAPIVNTVPLQLFAYYIADLRGIDVDKPRNLAKSVTVE